MDSDSRTKWTFCGVEYYFTYPVNRVWARNYLKDREGVEYHRIPKPK